MEVLTYDIDRIGEVYSRVKMNQSDVDMIFYSLCDRRDRAIKSGRVDDAKRLQSLIDIILDIDHEMCMLKRDGE